MNELKMMTELESLSTLELSLEGTDQKWTAEIEAQGTDHLRVRLLPSGLEVPRFTIGGSIQCSIEDNTGALSANARVLSQNGPTVWLNVEPQWRKGGRRAHVRLGGGFPISYEAGGNMGVAYCVNVSPGGVRLRAGEELPEDVPLTLIFRLPNLRKPLVVRGRVLNQQPMERPEPILVDEEEPQETCVEAGLKFVGIPFTEAARIASFCNQQS